MRCGPLRLLVLLGSLGDLQLRLWRQRNPLPFAPVPGRQQLPRFPSLLLYPGSWLHGVGLEGRVRRVRPAPRPPPAPRGATGASGVRRLRPAASARAPATAAAPARVPPFPLPQFATQISPPGACPGRRRKTEVIDAGPCSGGRDESWGAWSLLGECSVTCGIGFQRRQSLFGQSVGGQLGAFKGPRMQRRELPWRRRGFCHLRRWYDRPSNQTVPLF